MQAGDKEVEVFDNWYDPAGSMVVANGGDQEPRSDRLTIWSNQLSTTVTNLRNELRATRMQSFEQEEEARQALARMQETQEELSKQASVRASRRVFAHCGVT